MEYQTFCREGQDEELYDYFKEYRQAFFRYLGIDAERLRFQDHEKLTHYAKAACDLEYQFPLYSGKSLEVYDENTREHYLPFVAEATYGIDRTLLAVLTDALVDEVLPGEETRQVLHIKPSLAPYQVSVFPLIKKHHSDKARAIDDDTLKQDTVTVRKRDSMIQQVVSLAELEQWMNNNHDSHSD